MANVQKMTFISGIFDLNVTTSAFYILAEDLILEDIPKGLNTNFDGRINELYYLNYLITILSTF